MVSGKKKRTKESDYNIDLTYITPRLLAMSYPGSYLQKTYRNSIEEVSEFMQERHGNDYRIYNLSGIVYDEDKYFNKQVANYPWADHHSPPIDTLFRVCQDIHQWLQQDLAHVVNIHCLAGKGRTGTVICCYLLYSAKFNSVEHVLQYYQSKRFASGGGVTQPSQRRYIHYFYRLLTGEKVYPVVKYIQSIDMSCVPLVNGGKCRPFVEVHDVHNDCLLATSKVEYQQQQKYIHLQDDQINWINVHLSHLVQVQGDVLLHLCDHTKYNTNFLTRFAFNTAFIDNANEIDFDIYQLDPDKIQKDRRYPDNFVVRVQLSNLCDCTHLTPFNKKCNDCLPHLQHEQQQWDRIYSILDNYQPPDNYFATVLLFGYIELEDVQEVLRGKGEVDIYVHGRRGQEAHFYQKKEEEEEDPQEQY